MAKSREETVVEIQAKCTDVSRNGNQLGLFLAGGVWVGEKMLVHEYERVNGRLARLLPGTRRTAEQLHGEDDWQVLPDARRRLLGRCIRWLVRHEYLNLTPAMKLDGTPYKGGKKHYEVGGQS